MELDVDEVLCYLGIGGQAAESIRASVAVVTGKLTAVIQSRYTYRIYSLQKTEAGFPPPGTELVLPDVDVAKILEQCDQAVLMVCTLGTQFEALLRREQVRDMSRTIILVVCGSAWMEAGCNQVEQELTRCPPNRHRTDRFNPGHGDLPLSLQPKIYVTLDTQRRLGLYVTENYLTSPFKSVIAIIGLSDWPQMAYIRGCAYCSVRKTCKLRVGGKHCGN